MIQPQLKKYIIELRPLYCRNLKLIRQGSLFKAGRIEQSLAEHRAIMDALLARDEVLAARRVREHFASGLQAAS